MERKNQRISDLFYNNRFLLVFSIVAAIALWLVVAVEYGDEVTNTVTVPVKADFSNFENLGLSPFGFNSDSQENTVEVTVKGSRIVVDADNMSDRVSAKLQLKSSGVTGATTYDFDVVVKKTDENDTDFEIISSNADTKNYKIKFDQKVQGVEKVVEPEIDFGSFVDLEDYHILGEDKWTFSPNANRKISVSGPKTSIDKIDRVVAKKTIDKKKVTTSLSVQAEIQLLDKYGKNLLEDSENYLTVSLKEMTVEIPVYTVRELNAHYTCANIPAKYIKDQKNPFTVSFDPAVIKVAVPEAGVNNSNYLNVYTVDYSKLNSGVNTFTLETKDIENCIFLDGTEEITVTVDTGNMETLTVDAPDVSKVKQNMDLENRDITFVSVNFDKVTMVGPEESIAQLDPEELSITADLSSVPVDYTGAANVPAVILTEDCWSYCDETDGNYTVTVQIR